MSSYAVPPYVFEQKGTFTAPFTFTVPASLEIRPDTASAVFDGSGAGGAFLACLTFYSPDGARLCRMFNPNPVASGDVAEVTFIPPFGSSATGSTGGNIDTTDGTLSIDPTSELFIGQGIVLTNPSPGEARLDVNASGVELFYVEITSSVTITGTSGSQQTVYTLGPLTYDGSTRIRIETFTPTFDIEADGSTPGGGNLIAELWRDSTDLGRMAQANADGVSAHADNGWPMNTIRYVTPPSGSHTYYIKYWTTRGTPTITAGPGGGSGFYLPAWARISIA